VTCYTEGFSHFVTSMTAPVASGWSDLAGWDSHPLESAALSRRTREAAVAERDIGRLNWADSCLRFPGDCGRSESALSGSSNNRRPPASDRPKWAIMPMYKAELGGQNRRYMSTCQL
jgi:hypothetical protein